jgi:hypothetical protein
MKLVAATSSSCIGLVGLLYAPPGEPLSVANELNAVIVNGEDRVALYPDVGAAVPRQEKCVLPHCLNRAQRLGQEREHQLTTGQTSNRRGPLAFVYHEIPHLRATHVLPDFISPAIAEG